jgi:hypothetical protein
MLLAFFTLHKVQKYLNGYGLRRKEDITWLSLEACDPPELGWRDTEGHYFKIVSTIYSSNRNSISSGFHHTTHLVWLQKWHPLQYKGLWLQEIWLWHFGFTCTIIYKYSVHVLVPAQVYRCCFQIRKHNYWWWNLAFETISYGISSIPINFLNSTYGSENVLFDSKIVTLGR